MRVRGRVADLAVLRDAIAAAGTGHPAVVVVSGESGIGKTTLLREATEEAAADGWAVCWARGTATVGDVAYGMWRQAVGPAAGAVEDRFAAFEAVREQLLRRAPALLAIDDLQRVDEPSLRALLYVIRRLSDERVAIVATLRPEDAGASWSAVGGELLADVTVLRLQLGPLDEQDSVACLRDAAGTPLPDDVVHDAVALARGNPFYLQELGRSWASDSLRRVPPSVVDVTRQRLATLSTAAQELLLAASVLGEQCELAVLAHCVAEPAMQCLSRAQEAIDAKLVVHHGGGTIQFSHALVRAALLDSMSLPQRVQLHQRAAEAIEELHAAALDPYLADLARHAAAVAATGVREPALRWARAAADHARREFAYEEASRLYGLALDSGGPSLAAAQRAELMIARAEADARAGQIRAAHARCGEAVALVRELGDAALLARAALALEAVGDRDVDEAIGAWCVEALAMVDADDLAMRARLLARNAESLMYAGSWDDALPVSHEALQLAEQSGDHEAVVAALRARQLTISGPDHRDERIDLAKRMIALGRRHQRADIEMWGRLWTIDTLWEVAAISDITAEVGRLARCVEKQTSPLPRWHLLTARAVLAQARSEYDEAMSLAEQAFRLMQAMDHPAAFGAYVSLLTNVGHHRGQAPMAAQSAAERPSEAGQMRAELFGNIGPAFACVDLGRLDLAAELYSRTGPPTAWRIPPFFRISALAVATHVAVALGRREDVALFRDMLVPYRERHVVGGAGVGNYSGPVTLPLGMCAAALGEFDTAEADLGDAVATCRRIGLPGHAVEAQYELASVLQRRRRMSAATVLLRTARTEAQRLGMTAFVVKIDAALAEDANVLSRREREVADLVAQGCSNREIAQRLVLSERTAANHVQHVLTKLGLNRRGELAVWMARQ